MTLQNDEQVLEQKPMQNLEHEADDDSKSQRSPKQTPTFDYDLCIACAICATSCPVSAIVLTNYDVDELRTPYPKLGQRDCIGCGICEQMCPMLAIKMITPETVSAS